MYILFTSYCYKKYINFLYYKYIFFLCFFLYTYVHTYTNCNCYCGNRCFIKTLKQQRFLPQKLEIFLTS